MLAYLHMLLKIFLEGTLVALALMTLTWLFAYWRNNYSYVDAAWAFSLGPLASFYSLHLDGYPLRKTLLIGIAWIWSLRLGWHLFRRIYGKPEEGRYQKLRQGWKTHLPFKFLLFFLFQGVLASVLSVPFFVAMRNPMPEFSPFEWTALILFVIGIAGESLSDLQLKRFKANPTNQGRICNQGLWAYSRHPNYFFDWLVWVSFALGASAAQLGLFAWLSPVLMLYFFFFLTGIPPTEEQSLKSRGDAYRQYQLAVSPFFPWPPKKTK